MAHLPSCKIKIPGQRHQVPIHEFKVQCQHKERRRKSTQWGFKWVCKHEKRFGMINSQVYRRESWVWNSRGCSFGTTGPMSANKGMGREYGIQCSTLGRHSRLCKRVWQLSWHPWSKAFRMWKTMFPRNSCAVACSAAASHLVYHWSLDILKNQATSTSNCLVKFCSLSHQTLEIK